ncbi:MAG: glycosyltransferase family 4 protein, partial [Oricola sp.]
VEGAAIANPVPGWCARPSGGEPRGKAGGPDIVFVGHLIYPPNKEAVRRLVKRIMPLVTARYPEARLTVAGRTPNVRLAKLIESLPNARLCADPADLRPIYAGADMTLLPLFEGGGSRIKIIEALAVGCPVVASAKAVEGLDLVAGTHFLPAETPGAFAEAVTTLWSDPSTGAALRKAGMDYAWAVHGRDSIAASVRAAVRSVSAKTESSGRAAIGGAAGTDGD